MTGRISSSLLCTALFVGCLASAKGYAAPGVDPGTIVSEEPTIVVQENRDGPKVLIKILALTPDQQLKVGPILTKYQLRLAAIGKDEGLTPGERRSKRLDAWKNLADELRPFLDAGQAIRLDHFLQRLESKGRLELRQIVPLISVSYEQYHPLDSTARAIFGDNTGSFRAGIRDFFESPSKRYLFGISVDSLSIGSSSDKLFVLSPQVFLEYRIPVARDLSTFAKVSAGPAYMDYTYNTPDHEHFGAKRLGAIGEFEVGARYGRFQLAATYDALTQPSHLSLDGVDVSLTWIAVRF